VSNGEPNYTPAEAYTPAPDYSQAASHQPPPNEQQQNYLEQHTKENDAIEYDPVGQGLISAAAGVVQAGFSATGTFLGHLADEAGAWLGGEDVLALGEATLDQPSNTGAGGSGTGGDTGSDSSDGSDPTATDSDDGSAADPNMSVDPDTSEPNMSVDPGEGDYNAE
jgi:hypothetical protein